jgi:hypothetical protein
VRRAIQAGFDGFTINIMSLSGYLWDRTLRIIQAATQVDPTFDIILMPDGFTGVTGDQNTLATKMIELAAYPSVHRLTDNRLVIWPFLAENRGAAWWQQWCNLMASRGHPVAFIPTFNNYFGNAAAFAPISYGMSVWGGRSPATVANLTSMGNDAHARGCRWFHPIAIQDNRPYGGVYDEALNTETFRSMWASADACQADGIQVITWNDYSEATEVSPTDYMGWVPLDLISYYGVKYKLGAPQIVRDTIVVSHRRHPYAAVPTGGQTLLMSLRGGSSPPRDAVEVLTFLRQPSTVSVNVGGTVTNYSAPAGEFVRTVGFQNGTVSVSVTAADGRVTAVTSPFTISSTNTVQDLQYRLVSSGRSGTTTPPP